MELEKRSAASEAAATTTTITQVGDASSLPIYGIGRAFRAAAKNAGLFFRNYTIQSSERSTRRNARNAHSIADMAMQR